MRIMTVTICFLISCLGVTSLRLANAQDAPHSTAKYIPIYPPNMDCGRISSLFGATLDLDGSKRARPYRH